MRGEVVLQIGQRIGWLRFSNPIEVVEARALDEVTARFRAIEAAVDGGLYAAGFITYEAAPAFDSALRVRTPSALPLLWFGLYDRVEAIDLPAAP
ncbi:MAG TPA: aminodeoxychorismate synthase, component I, partial [Anaerolineae bacterium]